MEVSTSYCQPAANFKYGSYHDSEEAMSSMMEEEMYRIGSYGSHFDSSYHCDGSIGEEEEASSCGNDVDRDDGMVAEADEEMHSECYEMESDMTEDLDDENEEEEDEEDDDEWTNQKRSDNRNSVAYYAAMEMLRIRFPFQSISIRISDFCCLQEKDLLNDTMIDFYLNHIVEHILPDNVGRKVTVLPSVFWHNLSLRQHALDVEEEKLMTEAQKLDRKFHDLHDFVKDFDLHDFEYIVMPVNEWEHWSLAVICHPFTTQAKTVFFDSQLTADLNNLQNMAGLIEEFLQYSWMKRTGTRMPHAVPCVVPMNLPQQTNNFDCGVFIVEFARRFLMNAPADLDAFDFAREYPDFNISGKRTEMQKAVLSLCANRAQWRPLVELLNGYNTAAPHRAL